MKRKINLSVLLGLIIIITFFILNSPFADLYKEGFLVTMGILTAMWAFTLYIKDSSIIDIYWGFGYVLLSAIFAGTMLPPKFFVTTRNVLLSANTNSISEWNSNLTSGS